MKIAIIAEYNPFHNGHIYQLQKAKEMFPKDEIIIIMSGKYVQRGELAVAPFEDRKKIALKYGANQVIELPFKYATQAAHIFAAGAIKTAFEHGANKLLFGSESNDIKNLILIAKTIKKKESEYSYFLKKFLKQGGTSFPKAASMALTKIVGHAITMPNDILGLEYIKAIEFNNYKIKPYSIARTINFHSEVPNQNFASATYLREQIKQGKDVSKYTPMKFSNKIERIEDHYQNFQKIVRETPASELANIQMVSEGMENLFKKHIGASTYSEFVNKTNSRRYTSSRIKRVMLYILLNIKKPLK